MLTIETWPVLAQDSDWEMRQGPSERRPLSNGSSLTVEFVWSSTDGVTASYEVDGHPLEATPELDRARTEAVAEVYQILTEMWKSIETPNEERSE